MSYDRRWLEESGSEDSHGRTLWALAECARKDTDPSRRRWAAALFKTALPAVEEFSSPRAWAFSLLGLDAYCTLVGGRPLRQPHAQTIGRQVDVPVFCNGNQRLGLVRRPARIRQCAPSPGADPNGPDDPDASLRRGRPPIAPLAHVASDHVIRILQTGRDQELRQAPPEARSVRSAAGRSVSNDFRLPCCVAGGRRRGVAGRGDARVRLVSGRKRPADNTDRSRYGQLLGWAPSGSTQ